MLGEINCNAPVDTNVENYVVDMPKAGFMAKLEPRFLNRKIRHQGLHKKCKARKRLRKFAEVVSDFDENELLKKC